MLDFLVMRVLFPDPIRVIHPDAVPEPVSQIRVELSIRMETVTGLNHLLRITPFLNLSLQDLHRREIVVSTIEVLESSLFQNLLVDLA